MPDFKAIYPSYGIQTEFDFDEEDIACPSFLYENNPTTAEYCNKLPQEDYNRQYDTKHQLTDIIFPKIRYPEEDKPHSHFRCQLFDIVKPN